MKTYRTKVILTICAILWLTGCSSTKDVTTQERYTIGVVTKSRNSEYWMSVCAGMEEAASNLGAEVVILSPDTETDEKAQKKMIGDLIKMEVDALAVSPINSYDNQEYGSLSTEKGIPLYSYDTPIEDIDVPYIGIDNEKVGYEIATVMAEKMGFKGKVAIIAGSSKQASHEQRMEGFRKYMENQPQIQIETVKKGYSNLRVSDQEMEHILQTYPNLNGIMTTSAVTALGVMEATLGTGIAIATVDAQEDALHGVEDGKIAVLAAQSGYEIGYETISYIIGAKNGEKQSNEDILEAEILTRENVKEYQNLKK